ncbi:hypothetical protein Lpp120_1862 [Lacticaseibacillus paracasei subsp. paracasei Lpp120]|nr:hypothetical protein Lpp120_1862 [Lacticaseibacillus paracasei subsp. paracasei Lpp120]
MVLHVRGCSVADHRCSFVIMRSLETSWLICVHEKTAPKCWMRLII